MARFYSNENFPLPVVERLRELGHDVLTTDDTGKSGQRIPDEAVFEFAVEKNRAVLTLNRQDFFRIHRLNPIHPGIVACTFDHNFNAFAERIHRAILDCEEHFENKVVRIYRV